MIKVNKLEEERCYQWWGEHKLHRQQHDHTALHKSHSVEKMTDEQQVSGGVFTFTVISDFIYKTLEDNTNWTFLPLDIMCLLLSFCCFVNFLKVWLSFSVSVTFCLSFCHTRPIVCVSVSLPGYIFLPSCSPPPTDLYQLSVLFAGSALSQTHVFSDWTFLLHHFPYKL